MSILTFAAEQLNLTTGINVEFTDFKQMLELFDADESFLPSTTLSASSSSSTCCRTTHNHHHHCTISKESIVSSNNQTFESSLPHEECGMKLLEQITAIINPDRVSYSSRKQSTDIGILPEEEVKEIKKISLHSKPQKPIVPTQEEMYRLIDLELKDAPSALGLVWSSFNMPTNANPPSPIALQQSMRQQPQFSCSSPASNHSTTNSPSPLFPSSPNKITKKRKKSPKSNASQQQQAYRVRFGHNLFEEIEFKKSNPHQKFIIFK